MTNPSIALVAVAQLWHAQARAAVVVEVAATKGSVPREAGTRMLVAAGEVVGTIGGGHLEWQAIAQARALLAGNPRGAGALLALAGDNTPIRSGVSARSAANPATLVQHVALGPSLGQCCGGALDLRYTPLAELTESDIAAWAAAPPRFHLQLYGAGHVGRAIVRLLEGLNCKVQWIDEREAEFPPLTSSPSAAHIERLCVEPVQAEVALAPPGAFYLVLTHSHDLDLALTQAILARGDFGFFGLIGSKTKHARFEHRLRERGFDEALISRITCPIGLPGIEGKEPEVIAVAVVAQLLQVARALKS
jgi:xanthine dehydrogenase accessory factor